METARTDAGGRFHIAAWREPWSIDDLRFTSDGETYAVYKPGYRLQKMVPATRTFSIARYKGSAASYFQDVLFASSWSCSRARASSKNEYRLWKSMAEEAAVLAESPEEESRASMLRKFAEQSLVNFGKPTHIVGSHYDNIDPDDRLRIEELWP